MAAAETLPTVCKTLILILENSVARPLPRPPASTSFIGTAKEEKTRVEEIISVMVMLKMNLKISFIDY